MRRKQRAHIRSVLALLLVAMIGCRPAAPTSSANTVPVRDGVLVHVSAGPQQPHRLLMGLRMAVLMAEGGTRDVLVYFDIDGVKAVLADAEDVSLPSFPSLKTLLSQLRKAKVQLLACPGCLTAFGKQPGDLVEGVLAAERDLFTGFTKGRILALDY